MLLSKKQKDIFLNELIDFLKIPSVSADSNFQKEIYKAAKWTENSLKEAGCEKTEIFKTKGNPIVYGEKIIDPSLPTILTYGHYDVQPPDPIDLWDSPPFKPIIKKTKIHPDGAIFARGSCDDKGQLFIHIKALEIMISNNSLPCNVKFMIEGEEEIGSSNLEIFLKNNKQLLKNDIILISDTSIISNSQPSITNGLRGLSYMELILTGPNRDLHSGLYGGAVFNPINELAKIISKLHDSNNKISIPGFYKNVINISKNERNKMSLAPFDIKKYKKELEIEEVHGEKGFTTLERTSIRPSLDVNGIWGGYTGEGAKTVIPSKAHAKISMRLVPNQDWEEISMLFNKYVKSITPKGISLKIIKHHGGAPYITPTKSNGYKAAHLAYSESFKIEPLPQRGGGSIPIVPLFEKILKSKSILMGFGLDSDSIHSPNEHFGIFNLFKGIETIPIFYKNFKKFFMD